MKDLRQLARDTTKPAEKPRKQPALSEHVGPVVLCQECWRERVQYDWRKDLQLCPDCDPEQKEAA